MFVKNCNNFLNCSNYTNENICECNYYGLQKLTGETNKNPCFLKALDSIICELANTCTFNIFTAFPALGKFIRFKISQD